MGAIIDILFFSSFSQAQANKIQLDEKQEPLSDPPDQEEETTEEIFTGEEAKPVNELDKKPRLDEKEEPSDLESVDPNIFLEKDVQWGRKTLQNLLTMFGLLQHQIFHNGKV